MKPSKKIIDFIKDYEKLRLEAYMPTPNDHATIGYGMTMYPDGKKVKITDKITAIEAELFFTLLINKFATNINQYIKANLTQNQYDALLSLAYNIGVGAFKDSTILRRVNTCPCDSDIPSSFLVWDKQAGRTLPGLSKRRKQESDIYSKGIYDSKH